MEGIEVNLDTNVGKWLSKLADTVTRLAETQNISEVEFKKNRKYFIKLYKFFFYFRPMLTKTLK